MGYVENLKGDGSLLGILDATGGWLLGTLAPAWFFLTFFFLPVVTLLQWKDVRSPLLYILGGGLGGASAMVVFVWPAAYWAWLWLLVVPGCLAGITWWLLVVRRDPNVALQPIHD
ncbi:MAG TPA: hypothetical protein VFU20_01090 [Sphingomicrobium sp.]|nr:hypothetical protein [Sphingomicrobium sp.]